MSTKQARVFQGPRVAGGDSEGSRGVEIVMDRSLWPEETKEVDLRC